VTIDTLPDDALLEIFNRYREDQLYFFTWWWETLAHVCRRWRRIVFTSPGHLHLLLACNGSTPTTTSLGIWPSFPIAITCFPWHAQSEGGIENTIAALRCHDRVSEITFDGLGDSAFERFAAVMQEPFPALTYLRLASRNGTAMVLTDSFLGGSAPCLRSFTLVGISFPTFPSFALSASQLLSLRLWNIPDTGYISPEKMATCLATLPNLEALSIGFLLPRPRLVQISPLPPTRIPLPSLTHFAFRGHSGYLEDLRARLDTPSINEIEIHDIFL
jgi:hypothetical protein